MPDRDFHLLDTLRADLRRAYALTADPLAEPARSAPRFGFLSPRFAPVMLCRLAHALYRWRLTPLAKIVSLINFSLFGIEIAVKCPIGKGLFFPHTQGAVIGAESIGENVTIYHGVTLGARELDFDYSPGRRPIVEDDVLIGAGATILGGVTIGRGTRVGANALVMASTPPGALVRAPLAEVVASAPLP